MPTFAYTNADGDRVPGVTTVIGSNLGWSKNGLMWWANKHGRAGRDMKGAYDEANAAGAIGTCVHDRIEAYVHGLVVAG